MGDQPRGCIIWGVSVRIRLEFQNLNKIKMSFISIILLIWELPQIVLARLVTRKDDKLAHTVDGVQIYKTKRIEGLSLGDRIFVDTNCYDGTWLIKHEFGHVIQSRILGWLYIPIIVIPSYLWYQFNRLSNQPEWLAVYKYHQFYTERWANWLVC